MRRRSAPAIPDEYASLYLAARRVREAPYDRAEVFARWGGLCCYCDAPAEHLDHVKALALGGQDRESNVVPACAPCNLTKSDKTLARWAIDSTDPAHTAKQGSYT